MIDGHVTRMEKMRNTYRIIVENPEGKNPRERTRHRWENNIKIGLKEIAS